MMEGSRNGGTRGLLLKGQFNHDVCQIGCYFLPNTLDLDGYFKLKSFTAYFRFEFYHISIAHVETNWKSKNSSRGVNLHHSYNFEFTILAGLLLFTMCAFV